MGSPSVSKLNKSIARRGRLPSSEMPFTLLRHFIVMNKYITPTNIYLQGFVLALAGFVWEKNIEQARRSQIQ